MVHSALRIPEILLLIITEAQRRPASDAKPSSYLQEMIEQHATLNAIALVNKPFSEPALDLLWRNLPNMGPLISLLPISTDPWPPTKELIPNDWVRFSSYAARVRSIQYHPGLGDRHNPIMEWLCTTKSAPLPLVPQLRHILVPYSVTYPGFLIGHPLLELSIFSPPLGLIAPTDTQLSPIGPVIPSWLLTLPESSPDLKILSVQCADMSLANQIMVVQVALNLKGLNTVGLSIYPQLSMESLSRLSTSKHLQELKLELFETDFDVWKQGCMFTRFTSSTAFTSLKELDVTLGVGPYEWKSVLRQFFSSAPLQTLKFSALVGSPDDIFLPISEWSSTSHFSTLHTLHIKTPMRETSVVLTMDAIRPLFAIKGMRQLAIQGFFNLTNNDLLEIGRSFEELVQLSLFPGPLRVSGKPKLTLPGVRSLTQLRPSLEFLGLSINLARALATPLAAGAEPSRLKTLSLGTNSTLVDSENAYLFIRESWPALEDLMINVNLDMGRKPKIVMRFYELAGMVSNMI